MDIAPAYMPLMNIVASIRRVHLTEEGEMKAYRRVVSVDEVADYEQYKNTFKWSPVTDDFNNSVHDGIMLQKIGAARGFSRGEIDGELERRKNVLHWMRERNIRSYIDVATILTEYYSRPKEFYEREVEAYASA